MFAFCGICGKGCVARDEDPAKHAGCGRQELPARVTHGLAEDPPTSAYVRCLRGLWRVPCGSPTEARWR
jgi:hypothetical protein